MTDESRQRVELTGVPETLLWNLYHRAAEARRPDTVLPDPKAVELVERIDYPFEARLGPAHPLQAQTQALRVRTFDRAVREFLADHPGGTVVALGEGLETQFWRVDDGAVRWLTVELPETAQVRRRLLPDGDRRRTLDCSVLDPRWMGEVDAERGVLITAQGLLMYLEPEQALDLIARCAGRFPGAALAFDAVPRWFSRRTVEGRMSTPQGYRPPPMPWGLDAGELSTIRELSPAIAEVREIPPPRGRGLFASLVLPALRHVPGLRNMRPTMTVIARFAGPSG